MRFNSLASRFLAISALWSLIALVVTALLLTTLYRNTAQRNFNELLSAHLYNLMGAVDLDENGAITGTPNLGDPLFRQPFSGWYWSVTPQNSSPGANQRSLKSASLAEAVLETPDTARIPFRDGFLRTFQMQGLQGEMLSVAEAQIFLGEGDDIYRFLVAGNNDVLDFEIREFAQNLVLFLALFGLGMVISTFAIIKYGLRPLNRAKEALNDIRNGKAERLEGDFPDEIAPLVDEMNALIEANKSVLERARTQVGNLAHALKTPISVLQNEARNTDGELSKKVAEQVSSMHNQVQRYLDRARIAAQSGSINARTPATPVVERMVRVMERLNPHLQYEQMIDPSKPLVFRGEQQDFEEVLGNLVENASNFARKRVRISVQRLNPSEKQLKPPMLMLKIEDDGPGLSRDQRAEALKRGRRFDETRPGSGLGLSIVSDIVHEYKGTITLDDSELGGLSSTVCLPLADG